MPKQEIVDNNYDLSINKYKKTEYTAVSYPPTSQILDELDALNAQIEAGDQGTAGVARRMREAPANSDL